MNKNIMTYMGFEDNYDESKLVIFGAPFDGTTSFRPGTRFGPCNIRQEFYGLESYSPYLDEDLEDYKLFDGGDLDLPFGNTQKALEMIYDKALQITNDEKIPLMVGGEHLVSYGAVKAVAEKYPDLILLHFDAHADLRDDYLGEKFSHATVIRRIWDIIGDEKIYQFGIRSGDKEEFKWSKEHTCMEKFDVNSLDEIIEKIKNEKVYITIDLDILDPSIFPGTGTIEPGGISFNEFLKVIKKINKLNVVGADVVELSPHYDRSGTSTAVACKVIRELVLSIVSGRK